MLKMFEDEILVVNAKGSRRPKANPSHQEPSAPKVKSQSRSRSKSKERNSSSNLRLRSGGPSKPTFNVRIAEQSEEDEEESEKDEEEHQPRNLEIVKA